MTQSFRDKIARVVKDAIEDQIDWEKYYEASFEMPTDALCTLFSEELDGLKIKINPLDYMPNRSIKLLLIKDQNAKISALQEGLK